MEQHEKIKRKLKIIGIILTSVGAVCALVGLISFFISFSNMSGPPHLFFLCFIGFPMLGIGIAMLGYAYKREITRYVKDESVPVVNEAGEELKPAVKAIAQAVREGTQDRQEKICSCGAHNPADHNFCDKCGKPLSKICPNCGAVQDSDDAYCGKCGAKLE